MFGASFCLFFLAWDAVELLREVSFICPNAVIDPTDLGVTIVVCHLLILEYLQPIPDAEYLHFYQRY